MRLDTESKVMEAVQLALSATEQEESVRLRMEIFGFTPDFHQRGIMLMEQASSCRNKQVNLYDEQWSLSQKLYSQLDTVHAQFKEHAKVARMAFRKDADILHSLKIDSFAKQAWPSVKQAKYFYQQILDQDLNMQPYGISRKEIERANEAVSFLLELKDSRTRKKGMAESCTQEKNAAFKALRRWVTDFRAMARLAYKDSPQMLEMFGILVPSAS